MYECGLKKEECDFALSNGECSQPSISLEMCFKRQYNRKNNKKEIIKTIKRHIKGIEKAIEIVEQMIKDREYNLEIVDKEEIK